MVCYAPEVDSAVILRTCWRPFALNRLECVGAVLRHALNCLAVVAPDWLLSHSAPEWLERYGPRMEDYRLPESKDERVAFATIIGADGLALLRAVDTADAPDWLRTIPAVVTLRHVWIQNYTWTGASTLRWRTNDEIPPSAFRVVSVSWGRTPCVSS